MGDTATVFVVDDDPGVVRSICDLIERANLPVLGFTSGKEFLERYKPGQSGCLVLDLRMAEMGGLAVVERLASQNISLPTIIVTGSPDTRSCVRALKMGVCDFLEKPLDGEELLDCIRTALARLY